MCCINQHSAIPRGHAKAETEVGGEESEVSGGHSGLVGGPGARSGGGASSGLCVLVSPALRAGLQAIVQNRTNIMICVASSERVVGEIDVSSNAKI